MKTSLMLFLLLSTTVLAIDKKSSSNNKTFQQILPYGFSKSASAFNYEVNNWSWDKTLYLMCNQPRQGYGINMSNGAAFYCEPGELDVLDSGAEEVEIKGLQPGCWDLSYFFGWKANRGAACPHL